MNTLAMGNKLSLIFVFLLFLISKNYVIANSNSNTENGKELWTYININKKFGDYTLLLKYDLRLRDKFINDFKSTRFYIGGSYKINSNFKFSMIYRYIYKEENKSNDQLLLILSPKYKYKNIVFKSRLRYQYVNKETPENIFRTRIGIDYVFHNLLNPFTSYELYYRFNKPNKIDKFNKERYEIGNSFKLNKSNSLNLSYRFEKELNTEDQEKINIIKLEYELSI